MRLAVLALCVAGCGSPPAPRAAPKPAASVGSPDAPRAKAELPPLSELERTLAAELRASVEHLAGKIGERNSDKKWELADAADWLNGELEQAGYSVERQGYEAGDVAAQNLIAEVPGRVPEAGSIVIGAHYDSAPGSPGADDNASGVAAVLALAKRFQDKKPVRTLTFVLFALEEPPHFQEESMGSLVYAKRAAGRGDKITAMLSIESIGYYSDAANSQRYPEAIAPGHPTTGSFLGVVANPESAALVEGVVASLRQHASIPVEGATLAEDVAGFSDHWSFWQIGVSAAMVTDTAPFRNPHYHRPTDAVQTLDFERMARTVAGLVHVVGELGGVATRKS